SFSLVDGHRSRCPPLHSGAPIRSPDQVVEKRSCCAQTLLALPPKRWRHQPGRHPRIAAPATGGKGSTTMGERRDYDVLVIGSGFGGSVAALRLTEKGYRVGVVEAGRRFEDHEFAKTSWRLNKYLWAPQLGLFGVQRVHLLKDVMILAGAGVGGGSLNYANTLYKPPSPFFRDSQWAH